MAKLTQGMTFKIGGDKVLEVTGMSYDAGTRRQIDTTHCESEREEWVSGIPAAPELTIDWNWMFEDEGGKEAHQALVAGTTENMTLFIPGTPGVELTFLGEVVGFSTNGRANDKYSGQISVRSHTAVGGYPTPSA